MANTRRFFGLLAEYKTPADIFHACEKVRDAGYKQWDSYTPFPVHGLDKAMGIKRSILPVFVLIGGLTGATCGMTLQWWIHAVEYPILIAAKPYFSYQAFVPVTYELGILFSAFTAVFGMLGLNKLPRLHHPLFANERFRGVTDDRYFIAIETSDPKFDLDRTRRLLEESGAIQVEEVED